MRYHCITALSVLAAVLLVSLAKLLSPPWGDKHIRHTWGAVPENWESLGLPPSGTIIDLYVALKPEHEKALIDTLYEVSTPRHPKYGKHLSKEQVAELVAPHPNTLDLVNSWLEHHGIPSSSVSMTHGGNTLMLKGVSVAQADTLLDASYQLYRHVESNETIVRTVGYSLPVVLQGHVLTVVPTTTFFPPPRQRQTPLNCSGEAATGPVDSVSIENTTMLSSRKDEVNYALTPDFLRSLYETSEYVPSATDRNSLGIAGYLKDCPSPADLGAFMRRYRSDAVDATYTVQLVNGGEYDPGQPTKEGNLDIQYTGGMAYPTPITFYSTGEGPSTGTVDRMTAWLQYMLVQPRVPQTITTSYGQDERFGSSEYSVYVCDLLAQLGARGVSLFFATGDGGVGLGKTSDGSVQFNPHFPATCPYVTAVGGTTLYDPETGAEMSGGGFSDYFPRPPYQKEAVPNFLRNLGSQYQGLFNPNGRGIPDVSAQVLAFPVFLNGKRIWQGGTSGSTPVVASIFSLLNDYEISKNRDSLGFLNPWLYDTGFQTLFDITSGSNPGDGTEGFTATVGWDPVTGLGTPDFQEMQEMRDDMATPVP
ncbi:subtilisin-like protein [Lactarius quietus]|nr:subtilisin-like protein [Lactarius quietus]